MKRTVFAKAAISSLLVGSTMVGCTGAAFHPSAAAREIANPDRLATTAEKALASRDGNRAVEAAEAVVRAAPQDAAYRQLLGRAYVASGRFASAETALSDAMTLGNRDPRTIVSLVLVKVALGGSEAARDLLAAHADIVPAGDYGLAMAMAGDADEGVRILGQAIQDPSATARTRQNLAYAYALAGRWKDARLVAGLDLDALAANQRITQWAQTAAPAFASQRIAALMGVSIDNADLGQPAALALAPQAAPVEMAEATPVAVEPAPMEAAAVTPSVSDAALPAPATKIAVAAPAPAFSAASTPMRAAAVRPSEAKRSAVTAPRRVQAAFRPIARGNSNWVVQLGAYDSAAIAKEKWVSLANRNGEIAARPVLVSQITVNGASYSRLAVSGFGDRSGAVALCRSIRVRGGQCFVRENAPDAAPQRWALSLKGRQFASR
ncbi:MAG TPA: tetratricopeptide repeat protein [Sphingobium sp.]|nr:tetratricopeptide repeat protein [Sphingobium sp.]